MDDGGAPISPDVSVGDYTRAVLNILDDFDEAKSRVEDANEELRREVAERRQAEQALLEQSRALARSNAELEQFAYVASHDLQEPLRMVASYVQLLSSRYQGQLDGQADKYIGYAVEGARRMQALIAGLLELSRVGREVAPGRISADAALEQALRNLESAIEETGAVLVCEPLPDVVADSAKLVQVFQNLVGNALKFRTPGVVPHVRVSAVRRGSECAFAVTDNRREDGYADAEAPDLVMLDLNLPKKDGREVLAAVKADEAVRHIPVVVFTSSAAERDRLEAYRLHASCYVTKPADLQEFFAAFRAFEDFWMDVVSLPPRGA